MYQVQKGVQFTAARHGGTLYYLHGDPVREWCQLNASFCAAPKICVFRHFYAVTCCNMSTLNDIFALQTVTVVGCVTGRGVTMLNVTLRHYVLLRHVQFALCNFLGGGGVGSLGDSVTFRCATLL